MTDVPQAEMPRYRSHKEVWALKLGAAEVEEDGGVKLAPADDKYAMIVVPADDELAHRCRSGWKLHPDDPGYLVVYPDGFRSWSPTKAFEDGYMLFEQER